MPKFGGSGSWRNLQTLSTQTRPPIDRSVVTVVFALFHKQRLPPIYGAIMSTSHFRIFRAIERIDGESSTSNTSAEEEVGYEKLETESDLVGDQQRYRTEEFEV